MNTEKRELGLVGTTLALALPVGAFGLAVGAVMHGANPVPSDYSDVIAGAAIGLLVGGKIGFIWYLLAAAGRVFEKLEKL